MPKSLKARSTALAMALALLTIPSFFHDAAAQDVIYASPRATYSPQPDYPPDAKAAGIAGAVVIQLQIDAAGNVTDAKLVSGNPALTESALKTVRTWKFEPTQVSGRPVAVTSTITVNFGSPAPAAPPAAPAGEPYRLGSTSGITTPIIVSRVEPKYSDAARAAKLQGTVTLEAVVGKDGTVQVSRVIRGLGYGLDDNAIQALSQWKFRPATRNGQPVDVVLNVEVNFNLATGPPPATTVPNDNPESIVGALKWEIREEATGKILAQGDGPVRLKDVSVTELPGGGVAPRQTPKRIRLTDQFTLDMAEFPIANLSEKTGFGMVARRTDIQSFSFEWFTIQDSKHAVKLQEGGELGIDVKQIGPDWEVTRTEFKSDVSLRVIRMGIDPPGSPPYWRVNIFKGSNITWPSIVNGKVTPN